MSYTRYIMGISQTLAPGEKTIISSSPLEYDFQLDYIMVPDSITFDGEKTRLLFHHEQLVDGKVPASIALNSEMEKAQRDLYPKRHYQKGDSIVLGIFENVNSKPLLVKAAIVGDICEMKELA